MTDDTQDKKPPKLTLVQKRAIDASVEISLSPPEDIAYQHTVFCQARVEGRIQGCIRRMGELAPFRLPSVRRNTRRSRYCSLRLCLTVLRFRLTALLVLQRLKY